MNGHPPYLLAVLAIMLAIVGFAAYRILAERRPNHDRTAKRMEDAAGSAETKTGKG